ncbi:hemerythrin domain-containing protein [Pigmentiphaga aceris]|uniref:Hemerythrin domain-containing protein n=1 Tax=Pigmentiphaga aceris TaxID=1940612 RepID=A0A5C0B2Z5_9BURK|nr:hemerythrin domain-containing protein [Pigmentiphaga aceris]QEI08635.1 hemerythrin domain-containing protein [Pigmentiphaga aceris]
MNKATIPAAQKTCLSLLLDDHRKVKKLFREFESVKDDTRKEAIVREACMELTVHTQIEEELLYPALQEANHEAFGDMVDEAVVEHAGAKNLIAELESMKPGDDLYDAKFTVLAEYIEHHVKEEEEDLFPKVIRKKIDLQEVGAMMVERKEALMSEAMA